MEGERDGFKKNIIKEGGREERNIMEREKEKKDRRYYG